MKRILSLLLSVVMLVSAMLLVDFSAFAASKLPATSITSLSAKDNGFKIKWKKKSGITGYQIQYSTNSKFKKGNKSIKIKNVKTVSKKITKLKVAKKYYVRIRTYKGKKYSKWSKKKNIIIKPNKENHCTNNNNHSIKCGNMEKWFSSRDEIDKYWVEIDNYYFKQYQTGKITYEEYCKKSPYGYESWSCSYCGKWTGNFKYD